MLTKTFLERTDTLSLDSVDRTCRWRFVVLQIAAHILQLCSFGAFLARLPPMPHPLPSSKRLAHCHHISPPSNTLHVLSPFFSDNPRTSSRFIAHQNDVHTSVTYYNDSRMRLIGPRLCHVRSCWCSQSNHVFKKLPQSHSISNAPFFSCLTEAACEPVSHLQHHILPISLFVEASTNFEGALSIWLFPHIYALLKWIHCTVTLHALQHTSNSCFRCLHNFYSHIQHSSSVALYYFFAPTSKGFYICPQETFL